jgi:hypothetical protein
VNQGTNQPSPERRSASAGAHVLWALAHAAVATYTVDAEEAAWLCATVLVALHDGHDERATRALADLDELVGIRTIAIRQG